MILTTANNELEVAGPEIVVFLSIILAFIWKDLGSLEGVYIHFQAYEIVRHGIFMVY
jgi:hypothetical protein